MRNDEIFTHVKHRDELLNEGVSDATLSSKVRKGELYRLRPGVYCNEQWWLGLKYYEQYRAHIFAVFLANPEIVFTHLAAATLHGLAISNVPELIDVHTRVQSRGRGKLIRKHYSSTPVSSVQTHESGLRATSVIRTVVDCARFLPHKDAVVVADSALNQGLASYDVLAAALQQVSGWGYVKCRRVAETMSSHAESPGETLLRLILVDAGLPWPDEQIQVEVRGKSFRIDLGYKHLKIALEFDGNIKYTEFGARADQENLERYRESLLQNEGWIFRRYRWVDVRQRPHQIVKEIKRVIEQQQRMHGTEEKQPA